MKTKKLIWPLACCIPFLASCTSMETALSESWRIKSVYSVNSKTETPEALYQLGRYYQGQQRYAQAATAYRRALQASNNTLIEAHNGLGVIYAGQGLYNEAIAEFKAAISHAPGTGYLYNNLGHTFYLQGTYPDAVYALEQASILDPGNPRVLQNLSQAYAKLEGATKSLDNNLASGPVSPPEQAIAPLAQDETPSINQMLADTVVTQATVRAVEQAINQNTSAVTPMTAVKSRLETVQVAPNIFELRDRVTPIKMATAEILPEPILKIENKTPLRLEISNGNGITGFAKMMNGFLKGQGIQATRITNQKPFQVDVSQIQYRPGYKDAAQLLKSTLPGNLELVQSTMLRQDIQTRLLLGKDMQQHMAQLEPTEKTILMASNESILLTTGSATK